MHISDHELVFTNKNKNILDPTNPSFPPTNRSGQNVDVVTVGWQPSDADHPDPVTEAQDRDSMGGRAILNHFQSRVKPGQCACCLNFANFSENR